MQDNPEDDLNNKSFINYMITYLKWLNDLKKVMLEPFQKYFRNNDVTKLPKGERVGKCTSS